MTQHELNDYGLIVAFNINVVTIIESFDYVN